MKISERLIGPDTPPYVIAELSANHNGSLERALRTIEAAKQSGAHAVKLQSYTADTMTIDCDRPEFMIRGGLWDGFKLYDLYKWAETPYEWHKPIFEHARKIGITAFSTPFDETAVDLLEDLNTPAYKIASFEVIDLPLIRYVASTRKPMIISTGMATEIEIEEAVATARNSGCMDLVILHCISSYPAPLDQAALRQIPELSKRFNVLAGLSDHTLGATAAIAAVALGACVIEKHFTLSREDGGPDSEFSIEPSELKHLCDVVGGAWRALGNAGFARQVAEESSKIFRRSIYFVRDLEAGQKINAEDIRRIRPGLGLAPKYFNDVVGKRTRTKVTKGTPVTLDLLS